MIDNPDIHNNETTETEQRLWEVKEELEKLIRQTEKRDPYCYFEIGTALNNETGQAYVTVSVTNPGARMEPKAARFYAQQLMVFADYIEERNNERGFELVWKVVDGVEKAQD